jgi:hypothetical protein
MPPTDPGRTADDLYALVDLAALADEDTVAVAVVTRGSPSAPAEVRFVAARDEDTALALRLLHAVLDVLRASGAAGVVAAAAATDATRIALLDQAGFRPFRGKREPPARSSDRILWFSRDL